MSKFVTVDLPHDLPENWNQNHYVSPGGTEVGLTQKHGYNYLMKQVNNAQQAAAELSEGLDLMVGVNMLDNWYFIDPIDRRDGEVVDAEVEYFSNTGLTVLAGQLQAPSYARSVDSTYGRITINGEAFYVNASDIFKGHIASSAGAYCFDRWFGENCMMTRFRGLTQGVILRPTNPATGATMRQYIVNPSRLASKLVTVSVLVNGASEGSMLYLYKAPNTLSSSMVQISTMELHEGMNKLTITLPSDVGGSTYPYLAVGIYAPLEGYVQMAAIKLELGGYQTLAHERMPGNWILNEIPNKMLETVKCNGAPTTIGGIGMIVAPEDIGISTANVLVDAEVV